MIEKLIIPKSTKHSFSVFIGSICIGTICERTEYETYYSVDIPKNAEVRCNNSISISFYGPGGGITSPLPKQTPKNLVEAMNYFLGQLPDAVKPFVVFTESK